MTSSASRPSYGLKTTGLRKLTSSENRSCAAAKSFDSRRGAKRVASHPASSDASRVISPTPPSAFETGQPAFASFAIRSNSPASMPGHPPAGRQVDAADLEAAAVGRRQVDAGLGLDRFGLVTGVAERQREGHREAAGMGGGDQLLRVRPGPSSNRDPAE